MGSLLLLFTISILVIIFGIVVKTHNFTNYKEPQATFVQRQLAHYGHVPIPLIASDNWGSLGETGNDMLRTPGFKANYPLVEKSGIWKTIEKCESIKVMDCSAFDDPEFSLNCGLCLDIGKNHTNSPSTGGLVLLPDDKKTARNSNKSGFIPQYVPSLGFCPAGKMVSTKEECIKAQRNLLCEKNGSFDLPGCAQCYSDGNFTIIDPKETPGVIAGYGRILVVGAGILTIKEEGFDPRTNITLSPNKAFAFDLRAAEGKNIKFSVSPPPKSTDMNPINPYLAGYMLGRTFSGEWTQDLRQIVIIDEVTGRKPRSAGQALLNGVSIVKMAPGFGQTNMTISAFIPFTFVDTATKEASQCKGSPFITTQASASFLGSDPCYNKDSGPGKYNEECLQTAWVTNGCTSSGKGYPNDTTRNAVLMTAEDGSFRTINDISDYIYNLAIITATGIDQNGKKQSIQEWSNSSVLCTGNIISSPCELADSKGGTLSAECIVYLWNNEGSKKLWNGQNSPIGPTYYINDAKSLFKKGSTLRACQATGTLSPVTADGSIKNDIIAYWQSKGDLNTVKKLMADLHRAANAQAVSDDELSPYFTQCYGNIDFAKETPYVPPPPAPAAIAILAQHCDNTGWKKNFGVGTFTEVTDYNSDPSYITVPDGLSATLITRDDKNKQIVGPAVFNFCSEHGFNDNIKKIIIVKGKTPASPPPQVIDSGSVIFIGECENSDQPQSKVKLGIGKYNREQTTRMLWDALYPRTLTPHRQMFQRVIVPSGLTLKLYYYTKEQINIKEDEREEYRTTVIGPKGSGVYDEFITRECKVIDTNWWIGKWVDTKPYHSPQIHDSLHIEIKKTTDDDYGRDHLDSRNSTMKNLVLRGYFYTNSGKHTSPECPEPPPPPKQPPPIPYIPPSPIPPSAPDPCANLQVTFSTQSDGKGEIHKENSPPAFDPNGVNGDELERIFIRKFGVGKTWMSLDIPLGVSVTPWYLVEWSQTKSKSQRDPPIAGPKFIDFNQPEYNKYIYCPTFPGAPSVDPRLTPGNSRTYTTFVVATNDDCKRIPSTPAPAPPPPAPKPAPAPTPPAPAPYYPPAPKVQPPKPLFPEGTWVAQNCDGTGWSKKLNQGNSYPGVDFPADAGFVSAMGGSGVVEINYSSMGFAGEVNLCHFDGKGKVTRIFSY